MVTPACLVSFPVNLQVTTHSEDQTLLLGRALGAVLRPGDCVSLDGELGAGKTRLVRGIVAGVGLSTAAVSSPTYVIAQEYTIPVAATDLPPPARVVHVDAYRLRGADELESVGWDALLSLGEKTGHRPILLVEWADRIARVLPAGDTRCRVRISHEEDAPIDDSRRAFDITLPDVWSTRRGWTDFERVVKAMNQADASSETTPANIAPVKRAGTVCPITGKAVPPDSPTYPFADERAKMADLSRWLSGGYVVSREITADDLDEETPGEPAT